MSPHGSHGRATPAIERGLAGLATTALLAATVATQWNLDDNRRIDLRIYVRAVNGMAHGDLYRYGEHGVLGFTYPPAAALVLRPLTLVSEALATRLWLVVSVAVGFAAFWIAVRLVDGPRSIPAPAQPVLAALMLWAAPASLSLRFGQFNAVVVLLLCLDAAALTRATSRWSGIGSGLAAALKVTPIVAVAALVWARPRTAGRRAAATALAATAVTAIVAPRDSWRYWGSLVFDTRRVGEVGRTDNTSLRMLTTHLLGGAAGTAVWLVAACLVAVVGLRRARSLLDRHDALAAMCVAMAVSYAVSPITWMHHQWFATIALVLWAVRARAPWELAALAVGLVGQLDVAGLGEESVWLSTLRLAFAVAIVVGLPAADAADDALVAGDSGDVRLDRRRLAGHTAGPQDERDLQR